MRIRWTARALALLLAPATVLWAAPAAGAHEERTVGDLALAVGFGAEPAYAGQPNSVELLLERNGEAVVDLRNTLKATVSFGDQRTVLSFEPFFEIGESGTPGDYRAWFVPTQPGNYAFRIHGTVDGEKVDESFTSGPKTFDAVQGLSDATFPRVTAPSNDELAKRIEAESARTQASLDEASRAAASASDDAASARTVALIGVALGALGTIAAIGGLAMARRRSPA